MGGLQDWCALFYQPGAVVAVALADVVEVGAATVVGVAETV